jgi:hypothetical protein
MNSRPGPHLCPGAGHRPFHSDDPYAGTLARSVQEHQRSLSWTEMNRPDLALCPGAGIDPSAPMTPLCRRPRRRSVQEHRRSLGWTAMNSGLNNPFVQALAIDPSAR